ncbi:hypothetical protein B0H13DRAFT_1930568 [Mycena leptocephala]|nr:hypothetical protein B0H13DRAFT_1930568 [Mycena leptocephala]
MFSIKSLLFFTTAATLLQSSSCSGGGTTLSGIEVSDCRVVGLDSIAKSFKIIAGNGPPGAEFLFNLFSDNCSEYKEYAGAESTISRRVSRRGHLYSSRQLSPHSVGENFAEERLQDLNWSILMWARNRMHRDP